MKIVVLLCLFWALTGCQQQHLQIFPPLPSESLMTQTFTKAQMHEDIDALIAGALARHPNFHAYANLPAVYDYAEGLKSRLDGPLTRVQFYKIVGQLSHQFNDGHSMLIWPYPEYERLQERGHSVFPFAVEITPRGKVFIEQDYRDAEGNRLLAGSEIVAINNTPMPELLDELQKYAGGETPYLRLQFVAARFGLSLWAVKGFQDEFEIQLAGREGAIRVDGQQQWTAYPEASEDNSKPDFYYERLNDETGFLYLDHFDIEPSEFEDFVDDSFARIKRQKIQNLIIDVRNNTGGNTDTVTYLTRHLASKPFRLVSSLTEKLNADNRGWFNYKGAEGELVHTNWDEWQQPIADDKRFDGNAFVLIGPLTYSAGIVFATTVKDNEMARLVGEETEGFANQTAQGNLFNLPHSKLRAYITTRMLVRPSGERIRGGVKPDIEAKVTQTSLQNKKDVALNKALAIINSNT